jgi:hypothetical protein
VSEAVKPRVFVSSVVEGFGEMREAARRGIIAAGCEPLLLNEDYPSASVSPRNACLDGIESCDALVSIVGERGGWRAPSGKLVVEEELEHARKKGRQVFAFLQEVGRDSDATAFAERVSDFVDGRFRTTFQTPEELAGNVEKALKKAYGTQPMIRTVSGEGLDPILGRSRVEGREPFLRFVVSPERDEDVIELVELERSSFRDQVYRIAHDSSVALFSYEAAKSHCRTEQGVLFSQSSGYRSEKKTPDVYLEIEPRRIVIDRELGEVNDRNMFAGFTILETDLEKALRSCFSFANALCEELDRFRRHFRFWYGTSVANAAERVLVKEIPIGGMSLNFRGGERKPVVPEPPRLISRDDLASPGREIERVLVQYRRRLSART